MGSAAGVERVQLKIAHIQAPGGPLVRLSGDIDEQFDRKKILEVARRVVVFDLEGVRRISSFGVREWIKALKVIPAVSYYCFVRCRPAVMSQFNMVGKF